MNLWYKSQNKLYIPTPWGELQIGTKYRTITLWHRGRVHRVHRVYRSRKFKRAARIA